MGELKVHGLHALLRQMMVALCQKINPISEATLVEQGWGFPEEVSDGVAFASFYCSVLVPIRKLRKSIENPINSVYLQGLLACSLRIKFTVTKLLVPINLRKNILVGGISGR